MKFIKLPKIGSKINLKLRKKTDDDKDNASTKFLDAVDKEQAKEEVPYVAVVDDLKVDEQPDLKTDVATSTLEDKYNRLLDEYNNNPTQELSIEISKLQAQIVSGQADSGEKLADEIKDIEVTNTILTSEQITEKHTENMKKETPIKIPDEIPPVLNQTELELLAKVKQEEDKKISDEKYKKEQEYIQSQIEEDKIRYIQSQREKGAKIREERKARTPNIDALPNFIDFQEYTNIDWGSHTDDFVEPEPEIDQAIVDKINEQTEPDVLDEVRIHNIEEKFELPTKIIDIPVKTIIKKDENDVMVSEEPQSMPEIDLTLPDWLGIELAKVWHLMGEEAQLQLIKSHEEELQKELDKQKEVVIKKKKSIFGNKINFSSLKRQMSKPVDVDPTIKRSIFEKLLKKHTHRQLKDIEAYCFTCKHSVMAHQLKGKSVGCKECGCLITVSKILEITNTDFKTDEIDNETKEIEIETNQKPLICVCGHRQIVHKDKKFCEEKDCYCIGFKHITQDQNI